MPAVLHRVVLIGFMGSGKTSVGREVASRLGWRFVDFDDAVEARAGRSVAQIFDVDGQPRFRALEERVAEELLLEREVVLGSGGGWAAMPGRLERVPAGSATFWLQVSPGEAIRRTSAQPGARPLLDRPDALAEATRLLAERTPFYRHARWTVDTEGSSVEDVATEILGILAREYVDAQVK